MNKANKHFDVVVLAFFCPFIFFKDFFLTLKMKKIRKNKKIRTAKITEKITKGLAKRIII